MEQVRQHRLLRSITAIGDTFHDFTKLRTSVPRGHALARSEELFFFLSTRRSPAQRYAAKRKRWFDSGLSGLDPRIRPEGFEYVRGSDEPPLQ